MSLGEIERDVVIPWIAKENCLPSRPAESTEKERPGISGDHDHRDLEREGLNKPAM
ncbi:hypothetical protein Dimus_013771, partial [Dionaea muscipula]